MPIRKKIPPPSIVSLGPLDQRKYGALERERERWEKKKEICMRVYPKTMCKNFSGCRVLWTPSALFLTRTPQLTFLVARGPHVRCYTKHSRHLYGGVVLEACSLRSPGTLLIEFAIRHSWVSSSHGRQNCISVYTHHVCWNSTNVGTDFAQTGTEVIWSAHCRNEIHEDAGLYLDSPCRVYGQALAHWLSWV